MIEVVAPNLKRRLSGVTATVVRLIPLQARLIGIVATGPGLPAGLPHIPLISCLWLSRDRLRVWHARRNTEMLLGLVLKGLFRRRLKLLFTSASQRRHTGYTKWLIGKMDRVIATSDRTAGYLERPSTVIMHGIDTESFSPSPDRAALRARLGLPEGVLVGCYGRIRPSKGTDHFVRAMIRLLPDHPGVTALVMGRAVGKFRDFYEGLVAEVQAAGLSDRILFPPEVPVDQVADWYRALDLYVAPQRWEGFGLTPLEAMACGVPLVATRTGAFESLVVPEVGALVPPDDLPALTEAIAAALTWPLAEKGAAARARALSHHRIEDEAAAIVRIYREMLA
ncbi:glycosyltransferase family 4 protein [Stagnihabitans tardus]